MPRLPRVLRQSRGTTPRGYNLERELNSFNRGYQGPDQTPDALRHGGNGISSAPSESITVSAFHKGHVIRR